MNNRQDNGASLAYIWETHTHEQLLLVCEKDKPSTISILSCLYLFPLFFFFFPSFPPPKPPDFARTLRVPSRRIPLGRRKVLSLCSRGIRIHFVWVIYILGHTCEFSMWNLRTQSSTFPWSQMGIYFLISEGGFWARGWGTSHRWGNFSQMVALGLKRIFCREISSRLARLLELTGREEQKVVIC